MQVHLKVGLATVYAARMPDVTVQVIENPRNEVTKINTGRAITSTHSVSFMFLDID